ncbi:MAG: CotH kinase family protein [Ruminococcus sp.]|nr:CotH kinase family protein [Ruminococcus sp.]
MFNNKFKQYTALGLSVIMMLSAAASCASNSKAEVSDNVSISTENLSNDKKSYSANAEYDSKLFDTSYVHQINITISEEDWSDLTSSPTSKTKYQTDITIDGETINTVSFSTKGNTSLSSVADDEDSDRYSFKVNFGKYVDGQTYYGLNKLNLNNIYADATYMKDYLSYEIFRQAGVDSPLVSYVWLTVNGEDKGLYIAIEDISESYLERTDNSDSQLYKTETEMLGNMDKVGGKDFPDMKDGEMPPMGEGNMPSLSENTESESSDDSTSDSDKKSKEKGNKEFKSGGKMPSFGDGEMPSMPEGDFSGKFDGEMPSFGDGEMPSFGDGEMPSFSGGGMPGGMPGGFGSSSNGADLSYSDDDIESYSDIFDNAVTDADDEAKSRVVKALKTLSEGENIEDAVDTDEVIRYFAAHNFVLNYDSYTGSMLHNYFLCETDGKLSMLPWDYNLAFGGFGGAFDGNFGKDNKGSGDPDSNDTENKDKESFKTDATSLINTGIDTPLSSAETDSRPMWSWIASNEEYLEKYHEVYDELLTNYFESGKFEEQMNEIYEMILPYIEKQTSSFYDAEQFKTGFETLKEFCLLRAESIRAQLDGELSADTSKQSDDKKIDASGINIDDMGSQGMGKDKDGFPKGFGKDNMPDFSKDEDTDKKDEEPTA